MLPIVGGQNGNPGARRRIEAWLPLAARRGLVFPAIAVLLCGVPLSTSSAEEPFNRSVIVLSPDEADGRLVATREAIAFWNQALSDLNVRTRLLEPEIIIASPISRSLEAYVRLISQFGGRVPQGSAGPKQPVGLAELPGDIVVLLSTQPILSFAWPIADRGRYLLAIQTDRSPPLSASGVSRNVIAHELGHALGLVHNGNPTTLMCGPCRSDVFTSDEPPFLPLASQDRARLLKLDPPQ